MSLGVTSFGQMPLSITTVSVLKNSQNNNKIVIFNAAVGGFEPSNLRLLVDWSTTALQHMTALAYRQTRPVRMEPTRVKHKHLSLGP
jgi:hypothetical protein